MIKKTAVLLIISLFLTGCAKKSIREEISFSSWGSVSETAIVKKAISEFEAENPGIKVNFMHIPQNYFQKIHLLFASNTEPDVIFINNLNLPVYASRLVDLKGIVDTEAFYPQAIEGLSYEGRLLAVPRDISELVFYINLDKQKLPPQSWTIEDMLNIARTSTQNGVFGISYEDNTLYLMPYLRYFGGDVLDHDGNYVYNSEESTRAVDFYKSLRDLYHAAPLKSQAGSSTLAQMFMDGKLVMYLSGRWMYPKISEKAGFNWAVINFPSGKKPQPMDTSGWAISKNSKHKEAAVKLVRFLSDEKRSEYFTSTGLIVPARIGSSKLLESDKHNERIFIDIIPKLQATNVNKEYKRLTDSINAGLE